MHWSLYLVPLVPCILATQVLRQERNTKYEARPAVPIKKKPDKIEAQVKQLQKDNQSLKTTNTVVLTTCALIAAALAAKTIRSSQRLRHAQHDARAWRRVTMTMMKEGGYGQSSNPSVRSHNHRYDHSPSMDQIRREGVASPKGCSRSENNFDAVIAENESSGNTLPKTNESTAATATQIKSKVVAPMSSEWRKAVSTLSPVANQSSSSTSSLYSAIHPHEDWNWVPADHPPARNSWKRSRLPPWTVGYSTTPTAQAPLTGKEQVQSSTIQEEESSDLEEHLFRSALWPDSDPLKTSEAAFIVDEIFKDLDKSEQKQKQPAKSTIEIRKAKAKPAQKESTINKKEIDESTIWTESDSVKRNEAVLMADEIFKDLQNARKHRVDQSNATPTEGSKVAKDARPTSASDDSEKVKALERQVWALLARSQALEDNLRRKW